ncbi:hypothetical protein K458DRAFT_480530 [Lentithecium fluviatile CBS 122367]|uniref:Uncharacterized protein n=1 Tax=Lentithecium fluviatile CBS 122367 TaxID=1168545 RepID=A0A6G1ILU8_9PLEO|nr:hypothetical protein K458DRAFT_480530 [Lentithecium fluviatile CBS 122367]
MSDEVFAPYTLSLVRIRNPGSIRPPQAGHRQVSLELFSSSTSSSSSRTVSSSSTNPDSDAQYIKVPTHCNSAQTFEFIGFTSTQAQQLFEEKQRKETTTNSKLDITKCAIDWIWETCNAVEDCETLWEDTMRAAGIKLEIREALLRPQHQSIRKIQPLAAWLEELIETYYGALVGLNADILAHLGPEPKDVQPTLRGGGGEEDCTVPQTPGGHLAMFKSIEHRRSKGCIAKDGGLDLARLESSGSTDFKRRGGLYFTHQIWVAKHYSALITDACPVAKRRTVELHVPLEHFKAAKVWELSFGADWRNLVYHSRRDEKFPRELSKKVAEYGIISGPIAHSYNTRFGKLRHPDEITTAFQLQVQDEQLEEAIKGKAYMRQPEARMKLIPQPWDDN